MWKLIQDPAIMQRFLVRCWHVALFVGSVYLTSNPTSRYYWLLPALVLIASTSKSPFQLGQSQAQAFVVPASEITAGRLPCHPPGQPCEAVWGERGCPYRRAEIRA